MEALAVIPEAMMTEAEYLASKFEISPDFVDGYLEGRTWGEIEHSNWQQALRRGFLANTALVVGTELHIRVAEGGFRVADLAVFSKPPRGKYVTTPPLAVIEILSPSDSYRRLKGRMRDDARMGVQNLFVIENRTEFSEFKEDRFVPISTDISQLEGSDDVLSWQGAAEFLWPNDAA